MSFAFAHKAGQVAVPDRAAAEIRRRFRRSGKVPAVLLDMSLPGLALARGLGRAGVPVIAIDGHPGGWAHRCRYVTVLCSERVEDADALIAALDAVADVVGERPVLFPLHDDYVKLVSVHRERLAERYRFVFPGARAIESIVDKRAWQQHCESHGIATPATLMPANEDEVCAIAGGLRYPCIIKPAESRSWQREPAASQVEHRKAIEVADAAELLEQYRAICAIDPRLVVQEVVAGPSSSLVYVVSYVARDGVARGYFVGRKHRTSPMRFGRGTYVESVADPRAIELAARVIESLDYRGNIGIELKRDDRDGDYKVIEVNARFGFWDGFAAHCGLDLISVAYRDALGLATSPREGYRLGEHWLHLQLDLKTALEARRGGELDLGDWLASVARPHMSAVSAWDDPAPAFAHWSTFAARLLARRFRRLRRFG